MTLLILSIEIIIIKLVTKFERWRGTKAGFMTKGLTRVCVCVSRHIKDTPNHKKQYIVSLHLLLFMTSLTFNRTYLLPRHVRSHAYSHASLTSPLITTTSTWSYIKIDST